MSVRSYSTSLLEVIHTNSTAAAKPHIDSPATPISHSPPQRLNVPQLAVVAPPPQQTDPRQELNAPTAGGPAPSLHALIDATVNLDFPATPTLHLTPIQSPVPFLDITLNGVGTNSPATPISHPLPRRPLGESQPASVVHSSQQNDPGQELNVQAADGPAPSLPTSVEAAMSLDSPASSPTATPTSQNSPLPHSSQQSNYPQGSNTTSATNATINVDSPALYPSATLVSHSLQTDPFFGVEREGGAMAFVADSNHPPATPPLSLEPVDRSSTSPFTQIGRVRPRLPMPAFVPFTTGCYIPPRPSYFPFPTTATPLQVTQSGPQRPPEGSPSQSSFHFASPPAHSGQNSRMAQTTAAQANQNSPEGSLPRSQRSVRFASPPAPSNQSIQATQPNPQNSLEASAPSPPPSARTSSSPTRSNQTHSGHRTPRQVSSDAKREQRKSNAVKAMERLQGRSGQPDVGTPVGNFSERRSHSDDEADPDVSMSDAFNEGGDGSEDGDESEDGDGGEDGGEGLISNPEEQYEPTNLELTYEYLLSNPSQPLLTPCRRLL
ncbi:hypothetical protein HYPSUDRAFT_53989 [Hypholoma sublateritium FD-334 SS-4]|uniref:Uncharacterized protein n=1 Tax=Hypholoma sublateritium (strain FD-334 SS-4) TaxID=945553 RepID=A0A0D2MK96_HYPSF|nr:hypothetical protein HYPSUDRAFT_53989 [Hypholoma sublateritium FD-334 SS-4]